MGSSLDEKHPDYSQVGMASSHIWLRTENFGPAGPVALDQRRLAAPQYLHTGPIAVRYASL